MHAVVEVESLFDFFAKDGGDGFDHGAGRRGRKASSGTLFAGVAAEEDEGGEAFAFLGEGGVAADAEPGTAFEGVARFAEEFVHGGVVIDGDGVGACLVGLL